MEAEGAPNTEAVLLPDEAARHLRVCRTTVLRSASRRELAGELRIGRCLRFVAIELLGRGPRIDLPEICTVAELSGTLRVHPDTVRSAANNGELDGFHRIGTAMRFERDRVLRSLRCQVSGSRQGEKP